MATALILGASSGFGAAAVRAFARAGYDIVGVHLDRAAAQPSLDALTAEVEGLGRRIRLFNGNAANDERRSEILAALSDLAPGEVQVLLHSLAFGTLLPLAPLPGEKGARRNQIEMTLDVMASSLVYWVRDVVDAGWMGAGGRVFAMTSAGATQAWRGYGPVAAAKAALEAYVRQLAVELAPRQITVNAILAGATRTPALEKIPGAAVLVQRALERNPSGRLTTPEDVAACLVALAHPGTAWMTGNVLRVDGGESVAG